MLTSHVTEEKLRFLLENGVDLEIQSTRKENFFAKLLRETFFDYHANTIVLIAKLEQEYDDLRAAVARTPNIITSTIKCLGCESY